MVFVNRNPLARLLRRNEGIGGRTAGLFYHDSISKWYNPSMRPPLARSEVIQPEDRSFRFIALTQNQIAVVDYEDYAEVSRHNWAACEKCSGFYAYRRKKGRIVYLHRELMAGAKLVDHIDRDTLNNRRSNLREISKSGNAVNSKMNRRNSSGARGVSWSKGMNKWMTTIKRDGKYEYLGCHDTVELARQAYEDAAIRLNNL